MTSVLVTGAGGFIGGHLVARLRERGVEDSPWRRPGAPGRVAPALRRRRQPQCGDLQDLAACRSACDGVDVVYNLAADMGGHGVHREQQGAVHAVGADLDPHARGGPPGRCAALLLFLVRLRLRRGQAGVARGRAAAGGRRLPGHARGRLRLGEACSASGWPATSTRTSASRPASPATTTSTGPNGTYDGGREKAPGRDLPQGGRGRPERERGDRDLGRRQADPQSSPISMTASRARCA